MLRKTSFLLLTSVSLLTTHLAQAQMQQNTSQYSWLPDHGRVLATGTAVSDVRTIGGDGMLPVFGNNNGFAYADFMGDYASDDTYLVSPGLGYRQIINNQIAGAYFFGDYERTSLGENFWVISPGLEWMNTHWDAHVNGYFPTETAQQSGSGLYLSDFDNNSQVYFEEGTHNQYDQQVTPYAIIGNGVDAEVAYSFSELSGLRSRIYLGGYYYAPPSDTDVDNITGITAGFEQPISKNLHVSLFNSYDNVNNYAVGVSLTATFGQDSTIFSNNIHDRLLDPIERHVGIIDTGAGTYDQQYLKNEGIGLQYDNVYFIAPETQGTGNGTYGNATDLTQTSINAINSQSPSGARIYVQGGANAVYEVNEETATTDGEIQIASSPEYSGLFVYAGQDFYGRTADYTAPASSTEQPIISVDAENNYNGFIITENGENIFSDLTITEYSTSNGTGEHYTISGIAIYNETDDDTTVTINNTSITGMDTYGVYAKNSANGTLTINTDNSQFNSNGVLSSNGDSIDNAAGIYALNNPDNVSGTGTLIINANNSQFNDNGTMVGDNTLIYNNAAGIIAQNSGNGVLSGNNSSSYLSIGGIVTDNSTSGTITITATDSQFNDNGIISGTGATSSDTVAGIFVNNSEGGTLTVENLSGSTFNNNAQFGIYVNGNSTGSTIVNYTGTTFSGSQTNIAGNGINITWIPEAP